MGPECGRLNNTVVALLYEVQSTVRIAWKPLTDIRARQKKTKQNIFLHSQPSWLVFFFFYSSMSSLSLSSSTTKHTFDARHKLMQRLKQRPCVWLLFCFRCCYLRFQGFSSYYSIWLMCLRMLYLHCSTCIGFFQYLTQIYRNPFVRLTAHYTSQCGCLPCSLSGCGEGWVLLGHPVTVISGERPPWQMTLSAQLFTATQGSMSEPDGSSRPSNFLHHVLISSPSHRWLSTLSVWPS